MDGMLHRVRLLLGDTVVARLQDARIAIFGLGAVGARTAEFLARSGCARLFLVDFDRITASNANRLVFADSTTLGQLKAEVAAERLAAINPDGNFTARTAFAGPESVGELLAEAAAELVVDAIDSLNPKIALLAACLERRQAVVSSMGAASRRRVELVEAADLWRSHGCPLAARVRSGLRKRGFGGAALPVVFSAEQARKPFEADCRPEAETAGDYRRGRVRGVQPSAAWIPAVFAARLAEMVIDYFETGAALPD